MLCMHQEWPATIRGSCSICAKGSQAAEECQAAVAHATGPGASICMTAYGCQQLAMHTRGNHDHICCMYGPHSWSSPGHSSDACRSGRAVGYRTHLHRRPLWCPCSKPVLKLAHLRPQARLLLPVYALQSVPTVKGSDGQNLILSEQQLCRGARCTRRAELHAEKKL